MTKSDAVGGTQAVPSSEEIPTGTVPTCSTAAPHDTDTTIPASLRILQVCGVPDINDDHWLVEDHILFRLALSSLPRIKNAIYLHCIDLPKARSDDWIGKFGSSRAERVHTAHGINGTASMWQRKSKNLRKTFLDLLMDFTLATEPDDRLIVLISGHGYHDFGCEGGIHIGISSTSTAKLLLPEDVFKILKFTSGHTTLIVNSCHSGFWVSKLEARNTLDGGLRNLTIITRSDETGEIESHSQSGSGKYRGGFFVNCVVGRILREFGIHLPHPPVLIPDTTNIPPRGPPSYEKIFPDHNVGEVRLRRRLFSTVKDIIDDTTREMSTLRGTLPPVMMTGVNGTASHTFGLGTDYRMEITEVVPANPRSSPGTGHTGSGSHCSQYTAIALLVAQYRLLPLSSPTASRNVPVECRISLAELDKASPDQLKTVRKEIERRIKAVHAVRNIVIELGLSFPTHHRFPTTSHWKAWPMCQRFVIYMPGRTWNDARDLLLEAIRIGISGRQEKDIKELRKKLTRAIWRRRLLGMVGRT